jgi:PAS domain S-box-containing protein
MEMRSAVLRRNLAVMVAAAGLLVAGLAADPSPLVVTVAGVCLRFGDRVGLAVVAAMGALAGAILFLQTPIAMDDPVRLVSFLAAAFGVWLLIWIFRVASIQQRVQESTREIIEKLPGLGWSADANGHLRYRNPASLEYEGLTFDQMKQQLEADDYAWAQSIHPDDVERSLANFKHSIATGEPLYDESRARRHDGTYRWFRDVAFPTRDETGKITGWYGTSMDIDDQKKAEEALRRSERELRLLIDTVPTMIFLTTPDGLPYYFNKRFADWVGTDPGGETVEKVGGKSPYLELIHPDDRDQVASTVDNAFASGQPSQYKGRLRRNDGQYRWLDSRVEPLRDNDGAIVRWYGVIIDIDDEVRAQEALRLADDRLSRASRAASLSELSVSIAHELTSPLQAVVANANAFQRWLSATPPNYERAGRTADRIIRDANAAAEVIKRIRELFANTGQDRRHVDINLLAREVCDLMTDRVVASGVRLELALDPQLPDILADRVQLEQVILNLARNAIEAMQTLPPAARVLRIVSRRSGSDRLEVLVEDSGPGIAEPERIFEAFYTTKSDGMGMGLAICRSIIEAHGGRIYARPDAGQGSSVGFTLPLRFPSTVELGNLEDDAPVGQ